MTSSRERRAASQIARFCTKEQMKILRQLRLPWLRRRRAALQKVASESGFSRTSAGIRIHYKMKCTLGFLF